MDALFNQLGAGVAVGNSTCVGACVAVGSTATADSSVGDGEGIFAWGGAVGCDPAAATVAVGIGGAEAGVGVQPAIVNAPTRQNRSRQLRKVMIPLPRPGSDRKIPQTVQAVERQG